MATLAGSRRHRGWLDERGAELVEMTIVLPLLLAIMASIIDGALLFQRWEIVTNAAREGARIRVLPGYGNPDAIARANAYLQAAGLTPTHVPQVSASSIPAGGAGAPAFPAWVVTVRYTHNLTFLGPVLNLLGGSSLSSITMTGTSTMRSEIAAAP